MLAIKGHKDVECWNKEENASKRPNKWKNNSKGEEARVKALPMNIDFLNCCQE